MARRFFAFAVACVVPLAASALTIHVPDQAATIQSAIHMASPSSIDTVQVAPGTYNERPYIIGKNVVLRGSGADVTTLDGNFGGNVMTISFVSRACIIEDFTITGGEQATGDSVGAGIYVNQASPTVRRCRLVNNRGRAGGGLAIYVYSEPKIESCWVAHNNGGGIYVETGPIDMGTTYAEIIDTAIVRNGGDRHQCVPGSPRPTDELHDCVQRRRRLAHRSIRPGVAGELHHHLQRRSRDQPLRSHRVRASADLQQRVRQPGGELPRHQCRRCMLPGTRIRRRVVRPLFSERRPGQFPPAGVFAALHAATARCLRASRSFRRSLRLGLGELRRHHRTEHLGTGEAALSLSSTSPASG